MALCSRTCWTYSELPCQEWFTRQFYLGTVKFIISVKVSFTQYKPHSQKFNDSGAICLACQRKALQRPEGKVELVRRKCEEIIDSVGTIYQNEAPNDLNHRHSEVSFYIQEENTRIINFVWRETSVPFHYLRQNLEIKGL